MKVEVTSFCPTHDYADDEYLGDYMGVKEGPGALTLARAIAHDVNLEYPRALVILTIDDDPHDTEQYAGDEYDDACFEAACRRM